MKTLLLDIETSPNTVHVWGLWNQNVGINQILASGYVMCWAAKWYGEKDVMFDSIQRSSRKNMLKRIHHLLNEADAVIHYNGTKFDIPTLNKEFLTHGFLPPAPYKQIDLLRTARNQFRFPSNKLDYIATTLKLGSKIQHRGHQLWIDCMNEDPQAWEEMEEYNIQDVWLLEQVYEKLKPWIKGHANQNLYSEDVNRCPHCASERLQKRGQARTKFSIYQRLQCLDCGTWSRGTKPIYKQPVAGCVPL